MLKHLGWALLCAWAVVFSVYAAEPLQLTPEEQAYVQRQSAVRMCVDPDWAPFERLDPQGQHVGIAADLIQLVAQRTGLTIEPLVLATWDESLVASKAGRCQLMSFLNQTPDREKWLRFTAPIFSDPNVLITREEHAYIADLKLMEGQTIALPRGTMVEERIRKDFPMLKVTLTANEPEAIALVSERKADMTIRSLIVAAYTIKQEGLFNLKIAGQVPEYTNELRVGVLQTEPVLWGLLDKGVKSITPLEREAIANRHVAVQVQQGVDYRLVWKVVATALVVLLAVLIWHHKLRQLDRERAALAEARVEQALQAQRDQSHLVAMLSHEVRTALSMIDAAAGSLRLLVNPEDEPSLLRVTRIRAGVQRLTELTAQFLTKDRLESGALTPRLTLVDALALCTETVQSLDERHRVALDHQGDTWLEADPDLLQVALRNLLVNALRYTPPDSPVKVEMMGENGMFLIRVSDEGPGVPVAEQATIFSSYVRGSTGHGKPGSGLGLHLVKRVAQLHGGTVSLASRTGQGAVFTMALPRHQTPTISASEALKPPAPARRAGHPK